MVTFVTPFLGSKNDPKIGITLLTLVYKVPKKVTPNLGSQTHTFSCIFVSLACFSAGASWTCFRFDDDLAAQSKAFVE